MQPTTDLTAAIASAFGSLTHQEVHLLTLAMLHGMPIRQIVDGRLSSEETQDLMISALRKLRKALDESGHGSSALLQAYREQGPHQQT